MTWVINPLGKSIVGSNEWMNPDIMRHMGIRQIEVHTNGVNKQKKAQRKAQRKARRKNRSL
jgi:hypothetical protein